METNLTTILTFYLELSEYNNQMFRQPKVIKIRTGIYCQYDRNIFNEFITGYHLSQLNSVYPYFLNVHSVLHKGGERAGPLSYDLLFS